MGTMRRIGIITLIILIAVFALSRFKRQGGEKSKSVKAKPSTQSERMFNKTLELKSSSPEEALEKFEKILADFPQSSLAEKSLIEIAEIYQNQGKQLEAKAALKKIISDYPQGEMLASARKKLWDLNIHILFSPIKTNHSTIYTVKSGDSLFKIAKKHKTTVDLLSRSNNISGSLIKPGMKLKILKSVFKIEISKSENSLILKSDDEILKVYSVAIGKEASPTPVGSFKIVNRIVNPVWYKTGAIVPAGSAENILGTRWLGLSEPGYGIHGTVDTSAIKQQYTQGCIRMRNRDVEELFIIVPVGMQVVITD